MLSSQLEPSKKNFAYKINESQRDEMIRLYCEDGYSADASGRAVGVSRTTCTKELKKRGLPIRGGGKRTYELNEKYFSEIDTEEKAYWLGFLAADGGIYIDGTIMLSLASVDLDHIKKFSVAVSSTAPIRFFSVAGAFSVGIYPRLSVYSMSLVSDLEKHGVRRYKKDRTSPIDVPSDLMRHYWRGIFDGDGTAAIYASSNPHSRAGYSTFVVRLTSNYHVVSDFRDFVVGSGISAKAKIRKHYSIYSWGVGGRNLPLAVLEILYGNSSVYLNRKYDKWIQMINER